MLRDSDNVPGLAEFSSLDLTSTIAVKVLVFWPNSAKAWFVRTEAQFALKEVTVSSTKFYCCISSFNQDRKSGSGSY